MNTQVNTLDIEEKDAFVGLLGLRVLIYAPDHYNDPDFRRETVRMFIKKTIKKGTGWGSDFIIPVTIGKTTYNKNGTEVQVSWEEDGKKEDYFVAFEELGNNWMWKSYERYVFVITDQEELDYYDQYLEKHKRENKDSK